LFDFFKRQTSEGVAQLSNLVDAAGKGELGRGLAEAATYTQRSNEAFAAGLAKSSERLKNDIENAILGVGGEDALEDLEDVLIQADLGVKTASEVVEEVRSLVRGSDRRLSSDDVRSVMRGRLVEVLNDRVDERALRFSPGVGEGVTEGLRGLTVWFVMGANGMGKTTTIGKLARRLRVEGGQKVLLAACDTFRAGAVEQLELWAERAEVDCFGPNEKTNGPSAVLYGALDKAIAGGYNTIIIDTSGRLSNNQALNAELSKMKRVIQKRMSADSDGAPNVDVPHETLLVLDAAQGRIALDSALQWDKDIGLTGLVLTKLDGSARGGSVVAISREMGLPVKLVGVGEGIEDLRDFEPESFVDGLLGIGDGSSKDSAGKTEAQRLTSRLAKLRKERDERSKEIKMAPEPAEPARATAAVPDRGGERPTAPKRNGGKNKKKTEKKK